MEACRFYGRVLKTFQGLHCGAAGREGERSAVHVSWRLLFHGEPRVRVCVCARAHDTSRTNIPDNLNSSSEAILTDMSWEKRSFWGQANVSGRFVIGSFFSLAPKVLNGSR